MNPSPLSASALSARLRAGTRELHRDAEQAGVMAQLLRGRLDASGYLGLLHNLHAIYEAMEASLLDQRAHAAVAPIYDPALARSDALLADMSALCRVFGIARPAQYASATRDYVARLRSLAAAEVHGLVAHAYVRYLGDLSGGQMLRRVILSNPALAPSGAVDFYDFGDAATVQARVARFRAGLDAVAEVETRLDAIVTEAIDAFRRHVRLFEELMPTPRTFRGR